ncbi:ankyrin-1-like [Nasonia vitripennis]|uniref:Uncharacterized protein n=1 Tax=Nasonia vitripennis TaxID=7425 RepID=A0A7M7HAH4_NASVI|nr:ankyrin-1-like [Nasonia vitripennis]
MDHGVDLEARVVAQRTALHLAVRKGQVKVVQMLLERGANVNTVCTGNMTPLLESVYTSKVDELIPLLLKHGADINTKNDDGFNVLRLLTSSLDKEHIDLAKTLIEKGLSPCDVVSDQYHPLHVAVQKGKIKLVKLFLDFDADVNAVGFRDEFPLFVAAKDCEDPIMLLTLLERGAKIDQKLSSGLTALFTLISNQSSHPNKTH